MDENGASLPSSPLDDLPSPFSEIQHPKKRAFLAAYSYCGSLVGAAQAADCDRNMHYHWRKDPAYAAAFELAHEMAVHAHEDEASRRAMGWDETHYTKDGDPYTVRKYSDVMLIVRLKALAPEKYRENVKQRDERSDISELLKAVLLEMQERATLRSTTPEAEWAPLPPGARPPLPAPPDVALEGR